MQLLSVCQSSEFILKKNIFILTMYLRSVVVTGCSRGLGLELVKQLASNSSCCKIIASCRNPEEAKYLKQIESDKVLIKKLDVDDIDSFDNFAEEIKV